MNNIIPGGALPYVGGYQVPVNRPPFLRRSYTQWPPFFHFCIKFYIKIANFCALRAHFEKFNDFVAILKENSQILPWNCIFAHWMTPIFGSPHQKSPPLFFFWCPHRMTPFFWRNLTPNAPYFRSPVGTCTSLSYSAPPPTLSLVAIIAKNIVFTKIETLINCGDWLQHFRNQLIIVQFQDFVKIMHAKLTPIILTRLIYQIAANKLAN